MIGGLIVAALAIAATNALFDLGARVAPQRLRPLIEEAPQAVA